MFKMGIQKGRSCFKKNVSLSRKYSLILSNIHQINYFTKFTFTKFYSKHAILPYSKTVHKNFKYGTILSNTPSILNA